MSIRDHPLILQTLADYRYALRKHQQEQETRKQQSSKRSDREKKKPVGAVQRNWQPAKKPSVEPIPL